MELNNILEDRNTTFVRISEAADYLGTCIRENVVVFDVTANKNRATFLTESGYLVGAEYSINDEKIILSHFELESADDILSDEKVDTFVSENVGELVRSLNTNAYDAAESSFTKIIDAFSYRNQINEVRSELFKKMSRFDHKTVVRDTVEYCKLQEVKAQLKEFVEENKERILESTDVTNGLKLSKALSTAFDSPVVKLEEIVGLGSLVVSKKLKTSLYETICRQELINKELLESKKNFASLWADNETISRLASCIYSEDEAIEAAIVETIRDVPYFALASKSDINEVVTSVYEVTNPGTVSKKDIRTFVSRIFEMKKPAKAILISTLNENYGVNVNNLKFLPSFSNLAKTQSVMFEALSQLTEDTKVLSEFLHEFSSFIKGKGGVEVLDINDFLNEALDGVCSGAEWLTEGIDLEAVGEAVAAEYSLLEAKKNKEKPSDVGGNQYRGDDEQYIEAPDDEEEGTPKNKHKNGDDDDDDDKKDDGESKGDKGKDKDDPDAKDYEDGGDRKGDKGKGKDKDDDPDYTTDARKGDKGKGKDKDDDPDYTTDARKGDKGKGKDKDDDPDYTTDQRKGDKSKTHKGKDFQGSKKKGKLKEAVEAPVAPEGEVAPEEEDTPSQSGALSDDEIKDLVTDLKDLMNDLDFASLDADSDKEEDTDV